LAESSESYFAAKRTKILLKKKKNRTKGNSEFGMIRVGSRIHSKILGGVEAWKPKLANRLFRGSSGVPYHPREYPD